MQRVGYQGKESGDSLVVGVRRSLTRRAMSRVLENVCNHIDRNLPAIKSTTSNRLGQADSGLTAGNLGNRR
jgi:hypothetical protein